MKLTHSHIKKDKWIKLYSEFDNGENGPVGLIRLAWSANTARKKHR